MDTNPEKENTADLADWQAYHRRGEREALVRLVERYRRPLFGYLLRLAGDAGTAEDWFQETWARALARPRSFVRPPMAPWLFRIAHNLAMDSFRRSRREVPLAQTAEGEVTVADAGTQAPDRLVASRELGERIAAAVAELPEAQRETFSLRMDGRLAFREIADIQGCPLGTVLARMQYALAKLRAVLAADYSDWKEMR